MSATLAAFMLLASGRSLIPGLCATQAALDQNATSATEVCCPASIPKDTGEGVVLSAYQAPVHCAFCTVAKALVTVAHAPLPIAASPFSANIASIPVDQAISEARADTNVGRDPPFVSAC